MSTSNYRKFGFGQLGMIAALVLIATIWTSCKDNDGPKPVTISLSDQNFNIDENPEDGAAIGLLSASSSVGSAVTFAITDQSAAGALAIGANNGELTVADPTAFDYEVNSEITAEVTATTGDISQSAHVTVSIGDLVVPANGLVAYWPFDGNAEDVAGNADGTVSDGILLTADRHGNSDKAYQFNAAGQYIGLGDQDYFQGTDNTFSIAMWIKPSGGDALNTTLIGKISQQASTAGCGEFHEELLVGIDANARFRAIYYQDAEEQADRKYRWVQTPGFMNYESPNGHGWMHVVMTYDGSKDDNNGLDRVAFYVDGVLQTTSLPSGLSQQLGTVPEQIVDTDSHVGIGNNLNSTGDVCIDRAFRGEMDDVAIYDRILTAEEVEMMAGE